MVHDEFDHHGDVHEHRTKCLEEAGCKIQSDHVHLHPPVAKEPTKPPPSAATIMATAGKRALGGGIAGACAMVIQVLSLIWMRTTMNYQYRYGTTTRQAMRTLYAEGGIARFYKGVGFALLQGPLSRFGDTAANAGMLSILDSKESTKKLPVPVKSAFASVAAASWRMVIMPFDTAKSLCQVEGSKGLPILREKIRLGGPAVLWHGSFGAASATFAGHFPWFATFNTLNARIPKPPPGDLRLKLLRNAFLGFCSSLVADTVSNSLRVVKTTRQTYATPISYANAAKLVIEKDGMRGLFFRGLQTRLAANAVQGMMFSVAWKLIEERIRF